MISTLALVLASQVPVNVPLDAEVIYPLMPKLTPIAEAASGTKVSMTQSIYSTTVVLSRTEGSYETLALYKNAANVDGEVQLDLAFESWRYGFEDGISVEAKWADALVEPVSKTAVASVPATGKIGTFTLRYKLPVKKQATYSLKLKYKIPIGVSGVDREERLVACRVADIGQTAPINQFRFAVQFSPAIVFAPIEAKPEWGWQVGPDGAYLKLDGRRSDKDAVLVFRYYPPTL